VSGTVYLVGAGPGAADLLTLRAARLLARAEVVFHDALISREVLEICAEAELIPVGKRHGRHSTAQHFINKQLAEAARRHKVVVRLKGGDPMLFGRAQEEIDFLRKRRIPVEIVPGISAAFAASAALQTSLTLRGVSRSVVFATPRVGAGEERSAWARSAAAGDTVVLYMAAHDAAAVRDGLLRAGLKPGTPVVAIESVSLPEEKSKSGQLKNLPLFVAPGGGPVLLLLGEVFAQEAAAGRRSASQAA
jgi:uroporphyrin-III C-methyltransferase